MNCGKRKSNFNGDESLTYKHDDFSWLFDVDIIPKKKKEKKNSDFRIFLNKFLSELEKNKTAGNLSEQFGKMKIDENKKLTPI